MGFGKEETEAISMGPRWLCCGVVGPVTLIPRPGHPLSIDPIGSLITATDMAPLLPEVWGQHPRGRGTLASMILDTT